MERSFTSGVMHGLVIEGLGKVSCPSGKLFVYDERPSRSKDAEARNLCKERM